MSWTIRPARPDDVEQIATWTQDTFEWGDYVAEALPDWMAAEGSLTLIAEESGEPIGVSRALLMSPTEAWAQGTRIHPDHRRKGVGSDLARILAEWAAGEGARVMRSMIEDWNEAAQAQSRTLGYRHIGSWVRGGRGVGENSPVPEGNGGKRVAAAEGLRPAHSSEAAAALMSWSGGELERASRGLLPVGVWRMRRLTPEDLAEAARNRTLLSGRPGWAISEPAEAGVEVPWIATTETDVTALLRALVDGAAASGAEQIHVTVPAIDWLTRALRRRGFETFGLQIYAAPLDPSGA